MEKYKLSTIDENITAVANRFFLPRSFFTYEAGPLRKARASMRHNIERVKRVVNFSGEIMIAGSDKIEKSMKSALAAKLMNALV